MHRITPLLILTLAVAACRPGDDTARDDTAAVQDTTRSSTAATTVRAEVRNASGRSLGTLTLADAGQGITLSGQLSGLPPGMHGMHVHMTGQCEAPAFASAGEHWNPTTAQHGTQNPQGPHLGDLPNLNVGTDSTVSVNATTPGGSLRGTNALLDADGAAVVIHANADDNRTSPSGGSGRPIACGVVAAP